ncbi:MAG: hypothetical protein AAGD96_11185 [Chloroflexota bacterium]
MSLELINVLIVGTGVLLTIMMNWERLKEAPPWLIGFVFGVASGFTAGFFV